MDAKRYLLFAPPAIAIAALLATAAIAQTATAPPAGSAAATPDNAVLLTIFLRLASPRRTQRPTRQTGFL